MDFVLDPWEFKSLGEAGAPSLLRRMQLLPGVQCLLPHEFSLPASSRNPLTLLSTRYWGNGFWSG